MLPIFFDEAFTYLAYVRASLGDLLDPLASDRPMDANNHILNTLMAKASVGLLGVSELALRLPNLAALVSYLVFSWMLVRRFSGDLPPLAGFILLTANPFALELFAAARGYGLSLGFLAPALYLLARSVERPDSSPQRVALAFLLLAAATLASYPMLNVFGAAFLVWMAVDVRRAAAEDSRGGGARGIAKSFRRSGLLFLILAALLAAAGPVLIALSRGGAFYWGGTVGFWTDTVGSVVKATLYEAPYTTAVGPLLIGLVATGAAGMVVVACLPSLRRRAPGPMRVFTAIAAVTLLSATAIYAEHLVFGLRFPVDRVAVFFIPLFLLSLWLGFAALPRSGLGRSARVAVIALALASAIHLVAVARLWKSYLWSYDLDTPAMLGDLAAVRPKQAISRAVRLGAEPFFTAGVDYYRIAGDVSWLAPMNQLGPWGDYDFVYLLPRSIAEARSRGYEILRIYPRTGNALCRPPAPQ